MENEIKFIREVCIKANPEIVELKFGCQLFIQNYYISVTFIVDKSGWVVTEKTQYPLEYLGSSGGENLINFGKEHIQEIIGRSIRISDVLLAIGEANKPMTVNVLGYMKEWTHQKDATWDLKQDDLSLQSKETIEFLYELLK